MLTTQTAPAPVELAAVATTAPVAEVVATGAPRKHATVRIVTPAGAQSPIVKYANNPEFGYMRAESLAASFGLGAWARGSKRSTLIKGDIQTLEQILSEEVVDGALPGKLVVHEFELDDEFLVSPETALYRSMLNGTEDDDIEQRIEGIAKRAGKDGPLLTAEGNPILRFTLYVHTDQEDFATIVDKKVNHDNVGEVQAYQAEQKAKK